MRLETYLAKFYDVTVLEAGDIEGAIEGEQHIEIYEKGDDSEPIGFFVKLQDCGTYQYHNIYGKVQSGTAYNEQSLKAAAKAGAFI